MNEDEAFKRRKRAQNAVLIRRGENVFVEPWVKGLHWMIFSAVTLVIFESAQFSSFEFPPDTRFASIIVMVVAFGAGFINQRQEYSSFVREIERKEKEIELQESSQR